jgi:hypothetical protein
MNSLFIYLFFEIVGSRWFTQYVTDIAAGLMQMAALPAAVVGIGSALIVFALEWAMLLFLHRKRIYFRV